MRMPFAKTLALAVAAVFMLGAADDAWAAKKKRGKRQAAPVTTDSGVTRDLGITRDANGTPIIMQGYKPSSRLGRGDMPGDPAPEIRPQTRTERPASVRRGSSTYIPPPVPSPNGGPPAAALTQPGPGVYQPPPIRGFGDRATNCIHSFPLNSGVGGNPTELGAYTRSCAN